MENLTIQKIKSIYHKFLEGDNDAYHYLANKFIILKPNCIVEFKYKTSKPTENINIEEIFGMTITFYPIMLNIKTIKNEKIHPDGTVYFEDEEVAVGSCGIYNYDKPTIIEKDATAQTKTIPNIDIHWISCPNTQYLEPIKFI